MTNEELRAAVLDLAKVVERLAVAVENAKDPGVRTNEVGNAKFALQKVLNKLKS